MRTKRQNKFDFPPDIFWITPEGGCIEVIGHLTALQSHPENFGLEEPPATPSEIDEAFGSLMREGWVRGRYSNGIFSFQMERPRGVSLGNAHALVAKYADHANRVEIDFWNPAYARMEKDMRAGDFLAGKFPVAWGLNPPRKKRRQP